VDLEDWYLLRLENGRLLFKEPIMTDEGQIRADLSRCLSRLWRFGLVLSLQSDIASALVEATCVCALEREPLRTSCHRFDYCLFSILHSIWQTKASVLGTNSEMHVTGNAVLRRVTALPQEYRATVFLAYVEHISYSDVANVLAVPVSTVTRRLTCARIMLAEKTFGI
jgi:RNA polymerase sigma-70 factor (ECF subfamily)